jgi:hypothetical protein
MKAKAVGCPDDGERTGRGEENDHARGGKAPAHGCGMNAGYWPGRRQQRAGDQDQREHRREQESGKFRDDARGAGAGREADVEQRRAAADLVQREDHGEHRQREGDIVFDQRRVGEEVRIEA